MEKQTQLKKKIKHVNVASFAIVNSDAAGIDVASKMHVVAVPPGRDSINVKEFGAFTEDLQSIAEWLKKCKVDKVAMESTGVYWKQLYLVLIEHGFEVSLVNAKHVKNVTGRKTDMDDAQWIQKLHSCGLLRSSFLPDDLTESLRSLVRHRKSLIEDSSRYVLRMEKALDLMNIKIHGVISDLMGKSGTAILEAIIAGEREPENFMQHLDYRIKANREEIKKSLKGNWRNEHLFLLNENYKLYGFVQQRILSCEKEIELHMQRMGAVNNEGTIESIPQEGVLKKKNEKKSKNQPDFDVRGYLLKLHGVDVIDIFGIRENSAMEILAETGTDLSKWENEKKFVSWLNLCPNNKISGGKLISSMVLKKKTGLASKAFRAAANSVQKSDNWLGDFFRRKKARGGNKYAIIATARKIAIIYYKMVRYKQGFKPLDTEEYREDFKAAKIARLEKQIAKLKGAA
ncbi:MAG: IS110 family transposase [Ferruginibacter sp.]